MTLDDRQRARARQGQLAWAGFPADRQPRPLVLLHSPVRSGGFPDTQTKMAFLHGAFEAVPGFPAVVLQALRSQPEDPSDHVPGPSGSSGTFRGAMRFGICGPDTASPRTLQTSSIADAENGEGTVTDAAMPRCRRSDGEGLFSSGEQ
jgi:hypothetical protein